MGIGIFYTPIVLDLCWNNHSSLIRVEVGGCSAGVGAKNDPEPRHCFAHFLRQCLARFPLKFWRICFMEFYFLITFVQLLNYSNEFKENKTSYLLYLVHDSFFGKQPKSKGPDGYSVSRNPWLAE
jgi:hypothetical protein